MQIVSKGDICIKCQTSFSEEKKKKKAKFAQGLSWYVTKQDVILLNLIQSLVSIFYKLYQDWHLFYCNATHHKTWKCNHENTKPIKCLKKEISHTFR